MKKHILILFVLLSAIGYSQNGINYKALIRDDSGNAIANTTIQIQFTIIEDITDVYTEIHAPTTDANGIVIVNIGEGAVTFGDFNTINWAIRTHFLNVQIDTGSGFVDLGTTQFMSVPYAKYAETATIASNVNGLETIDEGNGFGWRLVGRNADNYGNIGDNATDLSTSISTSTTRGATGDFSTAMGFNSEASGAASTAMGNGTTASGNLSTALGHLTEASGITSTATGSITTASGNRSTAMGNDTTASGDISTAMGNNTTASGVRSTAMGSVSTASGHTSTAMGSGTNAESYVSTAIGRYNIGGGNPTSWIDTDPLFEIGNGTSSSNRSNALTILKNGQHTINSSARGLIVNTGGDGIVVASDDDGIQIFGQDIGAIISSSNVGANIYGENLGVYANGGQFQDGIPDIILGSSNSALYSDDGLISTNPERASSDMILRSYDDVSVRLDYDNNEAGNFRIRDGNGGVVFNVTESGNVNLDGILQIGTETIEDTGSNQLSVDASLIPNTDNAFRLGNSSNRWIGVWATDGTINTSDRREKKNIQNLNYGLSEILQMQPVSFNWKNKNNPDAKLGLIAQDVLNIIPEVVKTHIWEKDEISGVLTKKELDRLGVYYSDLVPVLIKAIQEQQEIIDNQNAKIEGLISELIELKSMNSRIKALEVLLNTKSKDVKVVSIHQ